MQRPRLIPGSEGAEHIFNNAKRKLTLSKRQIKQCWRLRRPIFRQHRQQTCGPPRGSAPRFRRFYRRVDMRQFWNLVCGRRFPTIRLHLTLVEVSRAFERPEACALRNDRHHA
jgi:hypothetical protein